MPHVSVDNDLALFDIDIVTHIVVPFKIKILLIE